MPELQPRVWALIIGGVVALVLLVGSIATRADREQEHLGHKVRRSQTLRIVFVILLLLLIVGFAFANAHTVSVDWIFARTSVPMVVVISSAGFVGSLLASRNRSE